MTFVVPAYIYLRHLQLARKFRPLKRRRATSEHLSK